MLGILEGKSRSSVMNSGRHPGIESVRWSYSPGKLRSAIRRSAGPISGSPECNPEIRNWLAASPDVRISSYLSGYSREHWILSAGESKLTVRLARFWFLNIWRHPDITGASELNSVQLRITGVIDPHTVLGLAKSCEPCLRSL